MSNEIKIEDIDRDVHMDEEIHDDKRCDTVERDGIYIGGLQRTFEVLVIFMVCHCGKKSRNPLPNFDQGQWINVGESVDLHLPNKGCNYKRYPQYDGDRFYARFKCDCKCGHESLSHPGGP